MRNAQAPQIRVYILIETQNNKPFDVFFSHFSEEQAIAECVQD